MTDAGITALSAGCGQLQSISLWGCTKVTDAGVTALSAGCGQLRSVDVGGCTKVTDAYRRFLLARNQSLTCSRDDPITAINMGVT